MPPDVQEAVLAHLEAPTVRTADALARAVTPFVVSLARRVDCPDPLASEDDLVLSGMLGVFEALERYDPASGVPFLAFARRRVHGAQIAYLRTLDPLPRGARRDLARIRRLEDEGVVRHGRPPAADALAAAADVSPARLAALRHAAGLRTLRPSGPDADGRADAVDRVADDAAADEATERRSLLAVLGRALDGLDPRARTAVTLYYLDDLPLTHVGEALGLSDTAAASHVRRGLEALRRTLVDTPRHAA